MALTLGMLLSIFVICFLVIIFIFRNPDHLKPLIIAQFQKYTGCEISIDDHLSFSFFPYFGVKAKHIQLVTPINTEISNTVLQLKLLPFLHGKIEAGTFEINELTLNQPNLRLIIKLNDIRLNISTGDDSDHSFKTMLSFNFNGNSILLSGNTKVDMTQQTASWENIQGVVSGATISGKLNAKNILNNPDISGHFTLQVSDLKNILNQINFELKKENIPRISNVNADINVFANSKGFSIQSNWYIQNVQNTIINIDDINAKVNFKNNLLDIQSISANVYGGYLNGQASVNLNAYSPAMNAHINVLNMQITPLFQIMQAAHANIYSDTKISGTANMEIDVTGNTLNNLNGTCHLSISNGLLMGKDWDEMVAKFAASNNIVINETISQNLRIFRFKQLSASFKINNGIFSNDDLLVDSPDVRIKGKGQINLGDNFVDYLLQAELQNTSIAIPIKNHFFQKD